MGSPDSPSFGSEDLDESDELQPAEEVPGEGGIPQVLCCEEIEIARINLDRYVGLITSPDDLSENPDFSKLVDFTKQLVEQLDTGELLKSVSPEEYKILVKNTAQRRLEFIKGINSSSYLPLQIDSSEVSGLSSFHNQQLIALFVMCVNSEIEKQSKKAVRQEIIKFTKTHSEIIAAYTGWVPDSSSPSLFFYIKDFNGGVGPLAFEFMDKLRDFCLQFYHYNPYEWIHCTSEDPRDPKYPEDVIIEEGEEEVGIIYDKRAEDAAA